MQFVFLIRDCDNRFVAKCHSQTEWSPYVELANEHSRHGASDHKNDHFRVIMQLYCCSAGGSEFLTLRFRKLP